MFQIFEQRPRASSMRARIAPPSSLASAAYPCNHFTHAGVDAALRLRAQGLAPADVTAIELGVAKPVLRTIAEPPEARARPASGYHAAFSGPYTVAAALLGGGLGVSHEDFTDAAARDHPHGRGTRGPRRGQPRRPRQPPVRRGAGEEVPRQRREVPPGGARGRARGPRPRPRTGGFRSRTARVRARS